MTRRDEALALLRRLRAAGHEAYFAGGCVRDRLRGVEAADYDIATSARPEQVLGLFERTVEVGVAFGVVRVVGECGDHEVATFRADLGRLDGRHPEAVRFTDAREDALRRDFTVNGMFEDPESGTIHDYVGGRADLEARLVRAIGDPRERFREDRLRMLRAVRFATALGFRIDRATMAAIREEAAGIRDVSAERIRDELTKTLVTGRGGRGVGLLREAGLLDLLLPEVAALHGVPQPARYHPEGDVLTHTRMLLDGFDPSAGGGEALAWAALLHDVGKPPTLKFEEGGRPAFPNHADRGAGMAVEVMTRLRHSNRTIDLVEELIARHMDWPSLPKMRAAKRRRFLLREHFPLHRELHRLDCEACHRDLALYRDSEEERQRLLAEPPPVRPLLSGHDLIQMGFTPGPAFAAMLTRLVDAQLEERVSTAAGAKAFLLDRFLPPTGRPLAEEAEE